MMRRAEYGAVITAVVFVAAMTAAGIWFGLDEVWHRMWALSPAVLAGLLLLSWSTTPCGRGVGTCSAFISASTFRRGVPGSTMSPASP